MTDSFPVHRKIFLVGPMGAGKSTLGRYLADYLSIPFFDSDAEIVKRTGADIPWIFDVEGEEGFRQRETELIDELTCLEPIVLATGGGVVLSEENRKYLQSRGTVIHLDVSVKVQLERTSRDKNRPLLQRPNPQKTLETMREARHPIYMSVADVTISTDSGDLKQVLSKVMDALLQMS